jgi:radical SAM superfamily enzyme YgiQ (UPF0313 family)
LGNPEKENLMKLKLISPKRKGNEREYFDAKFISFLSGMEKYECTFLSLATIAALTPQDFELQIVDENIEKIDFDGYVDIVGITCNTNVAPRAYEIADEFRKRGVKAVLGGIHPSMLPEEAIQHSDAIVIGEAEDVWSELLNDYKDGCLKQFYKSSEKPCLDNCPIPRYDLLQNEKYIFHIIQTTRGCPYDCEFCSVKPMLGSKCRYKPTEKIIREIETLINIQRKLIFFADDNFTGNRKQAKELTNKLAELKISYIIQAPISIAADDELLELFTKSRCRRVIIGFESLSESNLRQMNKAKCNKVEEYAKNIEKIQSYGIEVQGSFIFGYDCDDENIFENTVNFINDANIASPVVNILTPFPGTRLFERLKNENRILHTDWSRYDLSHVCFVPKLMSSETLQNGYIWARQQVYSYESIFKRLKNLWYLWNKNNVRLWDRVTPIITNLGSNDTAYSYPEALHPLKFKEQTPSPNSPPRHGGKKIVEKNVLKV